MTAFQQYLRQNISLKSMFLVASRFFSFGSNSLTYRMIFRSKYCLQKYFCPLELGKIMSLTTTCSGFVFFRAATAKQSKGDFIVLATESVLSSTSAHDVSEPSVSPTMPLDPYKMIHRNDSATPLAEQEITPEVLLEKYCKEGEVTAHDVRARVARGLAAVEKDPAAWETKFLWALENGFIPGGRINSAAGTSLQATLINCFVQPVGDAISGTSDGKPGIYDALQQAAETM
ncbi:MAG TPA: ribonucleotide reductase N-terminal alpha domain-containing protein, partial [Aquirhabdus sp.]